jgi:DNA mismatch endonuclease (patch repair protein)
MPKSRVKFWQDKFDRNVERDAEIKAKLERLGWRVETIWECDTKTPDRIVERLKEIFSGEAVL